MNRLPEISACMIVRNEAENIIKCLDSIKEYITQLIVVDTGSDDNTMELINEWKAQNPEIEVLAEYVAWNDSFADMRNISMAKASGDYIFIIDGDELLESFKFEPGYDYYICKMRLEEKGRFFDMESIRLFRNDERIMFYGARHATVDSSVKGMNGAHAEILTLHPELSREELDSKVKVNIDKHLKQLNDEPDNHSIKYHLSNCYSYTGDIQKAIDFGVLCLMYPLNTNLKALKCNELYFWYNQTGRTAIGLEYLKLSLMLQPEQVMARALFMQIAVQEGHEETANEQLEVIKKIIKEKSSKLPADTYYTDEELNNIRRIKYAG